MEVFNTSKEAGPLWSLTGEACQSPEEADSLSAAGQRAGGAESAGESLGFGHRSTRMCTKCIWCLRRRKWTEHKGFRNSGLLLPPKPPSRSRSSSSHTCGDLQNQTTSRMKQHHLRGKQSIMYNTWLVTVNRLVHDCTNMINRNNRNTKYKQNNKRHHFLPIDFSSTVWK